ncbi:LysE family translocator [Kitasatospora kifunensis]|uniref:Threonine/homoserine/homoserine lactone efflux protein n=1 Tax=Kitasatospora kifunensis TaxID=58351 RepID=A0A7W7R0J3_KITKI|nr:LysE family translocator [Kitasatospora kifunensis]MBB4922556.1 threonine/homoserine/homoserine lactone efflux protein [Kitasatospora kifunensis]
MDTHLLLLFLGVDLLLVCTPGPDWLYVVARSLGQGRRTGLTAVAGICAGYAVHTLLAAAGLAAALRAIPAALPALRYVGAAYLVLIAINMLRAARRGTPALAAAATDRSKASVLRQSLLTALLNPKGLLLYLSLIPQFIAPHAALPVGGQVAVLGALNVLACAGIYGAVALLAGRAGGSLTSTEQGARRVSTASAVLLLAVAAVTATA